jgi:spermidine synthase
MSPALLAAVLLIATCGLVYELVAGALASYLLGDSVTQFSTVIGAYLFAMGIGSWLSRFITRGLVRQFIVVQILIALVGGLSSAVLFLAFGWTDVFRPILYALVVVVGTLVGLEIPLLMRILRDRFEFKDVVAHVLTFDYLGALVASVLFPTLLVPQLGLLRAAMFFGLVNGVVALWTLYLFRDAISQRRSLAALAVVVMLVLSGGMVTANRLLDIAESGLYSDDVVFARTTPYQRIVLTAWRDDLRLFLNSHLQFSSRDEYRYHESLVHPGLSSVKARRVLILGGGDGLALREVLKYPDVEQVTLVDLDPEMPRLFSTHPELVKLNQGSFRDRRVHVVSADAMVWLDRTTDLFDFAIVDLPDPSNFSLGKLYTSLFYRMLGRHLSQTGAFAVQSSSPLFAPQSYWCVVRTIGDAGFQTTPYHVYVPSFGEWGFVLGTRAGYRRPAMLPDGLRFLTQATLDPLFEFPPDMREVPVEINRLHNQALVRYYEQEWRAFNR